MFWGLIMEPKRRYTQVVKRPFHISMAALDMFSADEEPTQVMLYFEERNYLLCTLHKGQTLQCPLDLNFETGDEVVFATNGNSNIHLSGYIQDQFDELLDEEGEEEEEEDEDVNVEESKASKTRKKKLKENSNAKQPPTKKSKLAELLAEEYGSDDEDESFVVSEAIDENDDDDDDDDVEEEEESGEDDEEKSDVSSLSVEEEVKKPVQQINGEKTKSQKKKQQQNLSRQEATPKSEKKAKNEKQSKADGQQKNAKNSKEIVSPGQQQRKTLEGGVVIQDLKVGEGQLAKPGKLVNVYYEGRLKQNNRVFDQSNKGAGFKFRLGKQEVINGWDIGVAGMKVGGRRRIICPPAMAYGQKGSPPAIPPNATLVFVVELKNVA